MLEPVAATVRQRTLASGMSYWQADVRVRLADGTVHRERRKTPGRTRGQALRWARERERHLLRHGPDSRPRARPEDHRGRPPRFADFVRRFLRDHVEANRLAPTTRLHYEVVLRGHLLPVLGERRLDEIGPAELQALKRRELKASTINGVLKKLKVILGRAVAWGVLPREAMPRFTPLREPRAQPAFYDFPDYARLVRAAASLNPSTHALVLLGGDAGLRSGELRGLRWRNVHLERNRIAVREQLTQLNHRRLPKGDKSRELPISRPLRACLEGMPRRGEHVVARLSDGHHISGPTLAANLARAQRRAGLEARGPHILRHTFCSHLAMRGVPLRTIQELAGHAKASTTEVYMHLAPQALDDAILRLRASDQL